ncbi:unnamed protein product, partial [Ectocarpus sp. 4 AP-2014]
STRGTCTAVARHLELRWLSDVNGKQSAQFSANFQTQFFPKKSRPRRLYYFVRNNWTSTRTTHDADQLRTCPQQSAVEVGIHSESHWLGVVSRLRQNLEGTILDNSIRKNRR